MTGYGSAARWASKRRSDTDIDIDIDIIGFIQSHIAYNESGHAWRRQTQVCDEFDKFLDSNFFVNCPWMEGVYWCCPLGPVQVFLCMLNPITCIVCNQRLERAKKECVAACNRILEPFGVAIAIIVQPAGPVVHWAALQGGLGSETNWPVQPTWGPISLGWPEIIVLTFNGLFTLYIGLWAVQRLV